MIRVVLVDDEPVAREGLRPWLATEPDVEVVGEAGTPAAAVGLILRERPDLVFLDVQMPEGDGFSALEGIGAEHVPEVVPATHGDYDVVLLDGTVLKLSRRFRARLLG